MGLDTLANVKLRLGITISSDDAFLQQQINVISDVIEAYCGRKFAEANWIQTYYKEDLNRGLILETYHYPIVQLNDPVSIDGLNLLDTQIRVHKPTGNIRRVDGSYFWGDAIIVTYKSGYAVIPSPIIEVLDSLVSERYNKKKSGVDLNFGSDVQRVSIPGAISIDFDYSLTNNDRVSAFGTLIGNFANVLDNWRSERVVVGSGKIEYVEVDT